MDKLVDWIMNHNTLIYSIFFCTMLIFALYWIVKYYVVNKHNLTSKQIVPLILTVILFAYSFEQISFGHFYKVLGFNMFTFYCLAAYLYADKINKRKIVDWIYWFLMTSSLLALALGPLPAFNEYFWYAGNRFSGIFGNPNTLQVCVSITLAITLTMFFRHNISRLKMYLRVSTLVALGLATRSKTFYVILALAILVYIIYEFTHNLKAALIEVGVLGVMIGLIYLIWGHRIIDYMISRIQVGGESIIDNILTHRWSIWGEYLGYWSEDTWALLFGKGMSSPDFVLGGTHNDFVFILYNLGTVGAALLLTLAVVYCVYGAGNRKHFSIWNILPLIVCICVCNTENLLIRMFSLLIVLSLMFVIDTEYYGKCYRKLNGSRVMMLATTDNMLWQFLIPHIKDLQAQGATVDLVCHETGFWYSELRDKYGFNVINVNMTRSPLSFANLAAYFKLCKLQRKNRYDLIYCQQPVGGMMGRLVGVTYRVPVIYTSHGNFFYRGNNKLKNFVYRTAEYIMSHWTDALITINDEDYNACRNWPAVHVYKINGIGLDTDKYDKSKWSKAKLRAELGIKPKDKVIVSVGEFIGRKNYPTMLSAIDELHDRMDNVKYVICGTGTGRQDIVDQVEQLGLSDQVILAGYRKDVDKIMQISSVMLHASFQEGLTMSIMEAMHFGLPVVTTKVRGNQDLIVDGKGGNLFDPYDACGMSDALYSILNNSDMAGKMSAYNKRRIKQYYLDTVTKQLHKIYKDVENLRTKD